MVYDYVEDNKYTSKYLITSLDYKSMVLLQNIMSSNLNNKDILINKNKFYQKIE